MDEFMNAAILEAQQGRQAGGIPIGSVLVKDGKIVGRVYGVSRCGSSRFEFR